MAGRNPHVGLPGGYAEDTGDTVEIHSNTIQAAKAAFRTASGSERV